MESHGTFHTLLNPIKQLMLRRSKLAIYGTSRSMELPTQWNFPLGFRALQCHEGHCERRVLSGSAPIE